MMLSEGIHLIGDGLLDIAQEKLNGLLVQDDINEIYDIEQTPFARGKFAAVRRAIHKKSGVHFAAKFLKRRRRAQSSDKEIKHEIAVLILCSGSDNIVKLNAVHESTSDTALLLELATGGELQAFLDNEGSLTEAQTRICMKEVLKALQYLHKKSIAHLDLKPQNILLTGQRIEDGLKLCDFGISRVIEHGSKVREILGTPDYVAPEVLQYEPLSLQTDMWSVGVLTYVLLTGCSPFAGDTKQETFLNISQCDLTFPDDLFDGVSENAIDFIKSTLRIKPNDRLTASDCLDHIWLKDEFPVDKRFYNISMASDGVSSDPDENLDDDFDDEDDTNEHCNNTTTNCCNTTRKSNGCTSKFINSLTNGRTTNTHRYKKLNDHDHHHNHHQQQQLQQHNTNDDDYNKENFLINSSEIVVLINNSVNNGSNSCNSPSNNSTNLIKTNRCSRDSNCYNSNNSNNSNSNGSTSNTLISPNKLINLDKNCSSSNITLNSSCSSSSLSSVIANSTATITTPINNTITATNVSTILFPDAPTTPKVIRKAPSSESPTSVKALVKKFQLESGEPLTTPALLKDTVVITTTTTTTTRNHHDDVILIENTNNITTIDGLKYNNRNNSCSTTTSTNSNIANDNNSSSSYKTSCVFCLTCGGPGCRHPNSNNSVVNSNKTSNSLGLDQGIIC